MSRTHAARFMVVNRVLIVAIVVLANLVGANAFFRLDLTASGAYRLSDVTRETLLRVEDPLRLRVYYAENVPAPYNGTRQYLIDLLREFEQAGAGRVEVDVVDVAESDARVEARGYGLQEIEIQEIRSDEFQSRAVFLGMVVEYGNAAEPIDQIVTSDGLEYRITTTLRRVIGQVDALAGATEPVTVRTIITPSLEPLIAGLGDLTAALPEMIDRINEDSYGRIEWEDLRPDTNGEVEELVGRFGVQPIEWRDQQTSATRIGALEVIIGYGERTRSLPIEIFQRLFGGFAVPTPEEVEAVIRNGLEGLLVANPRIAYATGIGERALEDAQRGAAPYRALLSDRFEIVPVAIDEEPIPADITTMIVNGPSVVMTEIARYRLDQFILRGGSLIVFHDPWIDEPITQQQALQGMQPGWRLHDRQFLDQLAHYGIEVATDEIVLDEESFVASQQGQRVDLVQAPVLRGASLNRESAMTRRLDDVIVLNAAVVRPVDEAPAADGVAFTTILESSDRAWTVASADEIGPWNTSLPPGEGGARYPLAIVAEGTFASAFDGPVRPPAPDEAASGDDPVDGALEADLDARHLAQSRTAGRIFVMGTSAPTTTQMLDPSQPTPNSTFLMNLVDVMNGAPGFADLRSKGLATPRLEIGNDATRAVIRVVNAVGAPLVVILAGLVAWLRRRARQARIQRIFLEEVR